MIPKVIHYCWFSGDPYPRKIKKCIASWKRHLPDYKFRLWTAKDLESIDLPAYAKEALAHKKWAFVADYVRMYALLTEGGVYLDSDVLVLKPLDSFLNHNFFSAIEFHQIQADRDGAWDMIDADGRRIKPGFVSGIMIQAAVMGAERGCPFAREVLDWYTDQSFVGPDGNLNMNVVSPEIYAYVAEKRGFLYKDEDQELDGGVHIYPSSHIAGNRHEVTPMTHAIHYCAHSWHMSPSEKIKNFFKKIVNSLKAK